ncbi:MAG: sulfite exporter TauE/SafE family protein [Proteobacteria bacterium]|nr:sulfite exporter TauE/SafE family protein [Pseudomonadota bacterium]
MFLPDLIPADLSLSLVLALLATAFASGLGRGFSGFGSALIFMPLASAMIGAKAASPLMLIIEVIAAIGLVPGAARIANRREVALMVIGSLVGVPLGALFLLYADPLTVRWLIVGLIVPLLALMMAGWRYRGRATSPLTIAVGAVAGFFGGVAQVSGPPIVMYWLRDAATPAVIRASVILYFAASDLILIVSYLIGGLFTMQIVGLAVITGPMFAIGLWGGAHMFGLASEATFRRACYAMIAVSAFISLPLFDGWLR